MRNPDRTLDDSIVELLAEVNTSAEELRDKQE